jgi:hypothetical protein
MLSGLSPPVETLRRLFMASATVPNTSVPAEAISASTVEHPLRNPDYRLWLIGGTISLLGDQFYLVALPWLVLQQTDSAVAMGAIMMSARKIMMATATARACWRTHGACRRRSFVPETSAGDCIGTPILPLCEIGSPIGEWHSFLANDARLGNYLPRFVIGGLFCSPPCKLENCQFGWLRRPATIRICSSRRLV